MSDSIAALVVTYNRLTKLKKNIQALKNISPNLLTKIIIIDNNSTDNTKKYLKKISTNTRFIIIHLNQNLGGAGGFNAGIKFFYNHTPFKFVWLMDDDTIPNENALNKLIKASSKVQASFYASNVRWIDGSPALMNKVKPIKNLGNGLEEIMKATFVSLMVKRDLIKKVGFPQKEYFIWGDDMEYTERLSRIKGGCFVLNSKVLHEIKFNIGAGDIFHEKTLSRLDRYYYEYRNRLLTGRRRNKTTKKMRPYIHTLIDFSKVIFGKTNYKIKKLNIMVKGTLAGLNFNPKIEYPDKKI